MDIFLRLKIKYLNEDLNIKTYVDLRSYTELNEDKDLNSGLFQNITNVYDIEKQKNIFSQYLNQLYIKFRLGLWGKSFLTMSSSSSGRYVHMIPLASHSRIARGVFTRMPLVIKVSILYYR